MNVLNIGYYLNFSNNSFWDQPHVEFTLDLIACLIFTNVLIGYLYKCYLNRINWVKYRDDNGKTQNEINLVDLVLLIIVNTSVTCGFEFNQQIIEDYFTPFLQNIFIFSFFSICIIILLMCIFSRAIGAKISKFMLSNKSTGYKLIKIICVISFMDVIMFILDWL